MFGFKQISRKMVGANKQQLRNLTVIPPANADKFYLEHESTIIPIDASWYMPNLPINGYHEFMKQRFSERAVFFDIEKIKDHLSKYPHMLPSKEVFEKEVGELGIKNDSELLFYDQQGVFSLCRAVWMFELFGHDVSKLNILNTYPAYCKSHGDPNLVMKVHGIKTLVQENLVTSPTPFPPSEYKAEFDSSKVIIYEQLLKLVEEDKIGSEFTLIDARAAPRFKGEVDEPRPGLSSGHIKNAINLPFTELLTPEKSFLSSMSLKNIFKNKNIDDSKPIIIMCGTGVTACVVRCAMQLAGFDSSKIAVYDGSWTEWGLRAPKSLIVKDV
jgi:thiosulfate/3-mercaptopyruvate sulfurtransferase